MTRAQPPIEPARPEPDTPEALCPVCAQPSGGRCLGHADCPLGATPVASTDARGGRGDWQPIEAAPSMRAVLVFVPRADHPENLPAGQAHIAYKTAPEPPLMQTWRHAVGPGRGQQAGWPSHWQPLPQPPHVPQPDNEGSREAHPIAVSPVVRARIAELQAALKPFAALVVGISHDAVATPSVCSVIANRLRELPVETFFKALSALTDEGENHE